MYIQFRGRPPGPLYPLGLICYCQGQPSVICLLLVWIDLSSLSVLFQNLPQWPMKYSIVYCILENIWTKISDSKSFARWLVCFLRSPCPPWICEKTANLWKGRESTKDLESLKRPQIPEKAPNPWKRPQICEKDCSSHLFTPPLLSFPSLPQCRIPFTPFASLCSLFTPFAPFTPPHSLPSPLPPQVVGILKQYKNAFAPFPPLHPCSWWPQQMVATLKPPCPLYSFCHPLLPLGPFAHAGGGDIKPLCPFTPLHPRDLGPLLHLPPFCSPSLPSLPFTPKT